VKEWIEKLVIVLIVALCLYVLSNKIKIQPPAVTEQELETIDSRHRFKLVPAGSIQKVNMKDSTITFSRFRIVPIGSAEDTHVHINIIVYLDKDSL